MTGSLCMYSIMLFSLLHKQNLMKHIFLVVLTQNHGWSAITLLHCQMIKITIPIMALVLDFLTMMMIQSYHVVTNLILPKGDRNIILLMETIMSAMMMMRSILRAALVRLLMQRKILSLLSSLWRHSLDDLSAEGKLQLDLAMFMVNHDAHQTLNAIYLLRGDGSAMLVLSLDRVALALLLHL